MADDDLTSKNWVWVPDKEELFVRGSITDYLSNGIVRVAIKNGVQNVTKEVEQKLLESCNPTKFNKCDDMAELTHLNEPSVIYNLFLRYNDDLIYTYSGLFLVAINPYKKLAIYKDSELRKFHSAATKEERLPPHIFAIAENSHRNLVANGKDQSILVTGESGAGKTENTKKIIQYLSQISSVDDAANVADHDNIHEKILLANPILESFGNAKTIKNNNSSRFGKFIKIFFDERGVIRGATIDYYLLEKSRVSHQSKQERNYHVFYQLLRGETPENLRTKYELSDKLSDYKYLSSSAASAANVDDASDFRRLTDSFKVMGFSDSEIDSVFEGLAAILHLGNLDFLSWKSDQASFAKDAKIPLIATLLGISADDLSANLLKPKVKAGREYVHKSQTALEVKSSIDAFAKYLYEKLFQFIINRIDSSLMPAGASDDHFIGVLDIAGFEIFEINSFEQLCINFTNEKLQQFFNHHSFILEQSEYLREDIQWEYIDFGLDLQPTIDLIETKKPMGVLEILNEQCILPKASDETFIHKLLENWGNGEVKQFRPNKTRSGFIIDHYAGLVEYDIENWLEKNKDPVSENVLSLMPASSKAFIRDLFAQNSSNESPAKRKNSAKFKTVTQKHKEQLADLMDSLGRTEPHFVRCILPNLQKKSNKFDKELVLHQLRCNGVLEGIRIARAGYPNKMTFEEFFSRYFILNTDDVFTKNMKTNCELILKHTTMQPDSFKIGITKLFFKNGILGILEEVRDSAIKRCLTSFQSMARGQLARTKIKKEISIIQASQVIAKNFSKLDELVNQAQSPWLKLFVNLKPLLEDSVKVLDTNEMNESVRKLNTKLKEMENAKSALESENSSLKDRLSALEDEIIKANQSFDKKLERLKSLESEELSNNSKLAEANRKLAEIKAVSVSLSENKTELMSKLENAERKLEEAEKNIRITKEELESERNYIKELESKSAKLSKKSEESSSMFEKKVLQYEEIQAEHDKAKQMISELNEKCKNYAEVSSTLNEKIAELENKTNELETTRTAHGKMEEEIRSLKSVHENAIAESEKNRKELASTDAKKKLLERENERLIEKMTQLEEQILSLKNEQKDSMAIEKELRESREKIEFLEAELRDKRTRLNEQDKIIVDNRLKLSILEKQLESVKDLESQLTEAKSENMLISADLNESKAALLRTIDSHKTSLAEFDRMKHEIEFLSRTKAEYSDKINTLRENIEKLESKLQDKENVPPEIPKIDPNIVNEYASIRAKMNEQSAIIRNEKFENQKLSEEVRMLQQKLNDNFESPSKRSEARRSLAMGENLRGSQTYESKYLEEINNLKLKLQQEEAHAARAENYAIELQKKVNRLRATRGIDSFTDFESKYRQSQSHVEELEKRIHSVVSENENYSESGRPISRSISNSLVNSSNSADFAKLYNDISHTLKSTREELNKSKSEILRLKSLLRESEDELYEIKRGNMKTSVRDYEEQLAKLHVEKESTSGRLAETQETLEKIMKKCDEYRSKLELAESAAAMSKRREEQSHKDLEVKSTELKLIKEEVRASEKIIKQVRQEKNQLELKLKNSLNDEERSKSQIQKLENQIQYLNDTYGDRKDTIEQNRVEIRSLREDIKFKLEKETEIIKENKRLKIDNEELLRVKEEVLAENKEVNDENQDLVEKNSQLSTEINVLVNEKQIHERKLEQCGKQIESLREIVEENGRQLEALNTYNRSLEKNKEKLESQIVDLTDELNEAKHSLKIVKNHISNLEEEKKQTRDELDDLRGRWDNSDGRFKQARTENLVIVQENESLRAVNSELKRKVGDLEAKLYSNEQLKYLESNMEVLNKEIDRLKHRISEGDVREETLRKQVATLEYDNASRASQLKKYNDENFSQQNTIGQYRGKIEFLYQENSEKDLKIKAQQRELLSLRDKLSQLSSHRSPVK